MVRIPIPTIVSDINRALFITMCIFFNSIQIKYGSYWGDSHPPTTLDDLDVETYEFYSDENLVKILVKSDEHIFGIRLITNTHSYGDLTSHKSIASSFTLPEYHTGLYYQSVAYFTGYAGATATRSWQSFQYVSGLQIHHHYEDCQGKFYLKYDHFGLPRPCSIMHRSRTHSFGSFQKLKSNL